MVSGCKEGLIVQGNDVDQTHFLWCYIQDGSQSSTGTSEAILWNMWATGGGDDGWGWGADRF